MRDFTYYVPTEIVFGRQTELRAGELCKKHGAHCVMLVYGGDSAIRSGLVARVAKSLEEESLHVVLLGGVQPNPRIEKAGEGVALAIHEGVDFVLAIGGGSVIDTAKAIAIGIKKPEVTRLWDIWEKGLPVSETADVGAIVTIPASGSETSGSAVLTNESAHRKLSVRTTLNVPRFAILNPELCATLSAYQMACGVVDIMMHTIDRYFNGCFDNETSDEIAEAVLRTVIRNGTRAVNDRSDYQAVSEIMWCGSLSHNSLTGLGGTRDFAIHKLGNELSAFYDVVHGASLSAVWDSWAHAVLMSHPERFARFGRCVWDITMGTDQEIGDSAIAATTSLFRQLGMPTNIGELGLNLQIEDVRHLASVCTQGGAKTIGIFKELDEEEIAQIYMNAMRKHSDKE